MVWIIFMIFSLKYHLNWWATEPWRNYAIQNIQNSNAYIWWSQPWSWSIEKPIICEKSIALMSCDTIHRQRQVVPTTTKNTWAKNKINNTSEGNDDDNGCFRQWENKKILYYSFMRCAVAGNSLYSTVSPKSFQIWFLLFPKKKNACDFLCAKRKFPFFRRLSNTFCVPFFFFFFSFTHEILNNNENGISPNELCYLRNKNRILNLLSEFK